MSSANLNTLLPTPPPVVAIKEANYRHLRGLIWFYFVLWVLEGALRKWIFPGLANPLLVVRDPVLLVIYVLAFSQGVFPKNAFVGWIAGLGVVAFMVSFVATETPLPIALYGLRAGYLHLPLIFVIGVLFDVSDVTRIGKLVLWMGPPMALLVLLQFRARDSSWLNTGAGGGGGGMIESAFGHIRPSGTFSFTNGLSGFTAMVAAFFLYDLLEKGVYPRWLWLAAAPALIVQITLSGSRLAVGTLFLLLSTVFLISVLQPRHMSSVIKLIVLVAAAFLVLGSFAIFKEGMSVFSYRFGTATNVQTGFFGRFFRSLTEPFAVIKDSTLGGRGLGMGTNVAAGILQGKRGFLMAEGDPARVLLESGPIVGCAYLFLRASLVVYLGWISLVTVKRQGKTLPLLLFAGCFNDLLQGQFSQPTELGYATIAGGLCLAANHTKRQTDVDAEAAVVTPAPEPESEKEPELPPPGRRIPGPVMAQMARMGRPVPEKQEPAREPAGALPPPPAPRGRARLAERLHRPPGQD